MGDQRCVIKIEFDIHGKVYRFGGEEGAWINYSPDDDGLDDRVREFFRESWADASARYQAEINQYHAKERAREIERDEREQLARLKAKYE